MWEFLFFLFSIRICRLWAGVRKKGVFWYHFLEKTSPFLFLKTEPLYRYTKGL